jgi:hypothetical protein
MSVSKKTRESVRNKYNGLCAYTGKPLDDKWQVDHVISKFRFGYGISGECGTRDEYEKKLKEVDLIDNLLPALRIVNHYKRCKDLELFRSYMLSFHLRLKNLPKNTQAERSISRKEYMFKVADAFDITVTKPFDGIFYFEKQKNHQL